MSLLEDTKRKKSVAVLLQTADVSRFVELMLFAPLSRMEKIKLTVFWRKRHGVEQVAIVHARNRLEYYRRLKNKNAAERLREYNERNNYAEKRTRWTDAKLSEFLDRNESAKARELARHFSCSVPAIQCLRRKLKLLSRVGVIVRAEILAGLRKSEKELRERVENENRKN